MKIQKIIQINEILNSMLKVKVPSKLAYKLYKFKKEIEEDCVFYNTRLVDLLKDNCVLDENGNVLPMSNNTYKLKENCVDKFKKESKDLDSLEIEKPNFTFHIEELEPFHLSMEDIIVLSDFIVEE